MAIELPPPIAIYFGSPNAHDMTALDAFAADAAVHDEGKIHRGLAAIKDWRSKTAKKYNHVVEPLAISERDGKLVVRAKVSGTFPGSPIELDHIFEIADDRVILLEIR